MLALITAIAAPLVAGLFGLIQTLNGTGLHRHIKDHAAIVESLPENSAARQAVEDLVQFEAEQILERQRTRLTRKLNKSYLTLAIILTLITFGVIYGLIVWTQALLGSGWVAIPIGLLATLGLFLVIFTAVGYSTIYNPPTPKKATK